MKNEYARIPVKKDGNLDKKCGSAAAASHFLLMMEGMRR
jgi:hypothetical protein